MDISEAREYYEAGQLSVYARLIRERIISEEMTAKLTNPEFAQQAKALSCSRQCVDGPWIFRQERFNTVKEDKNEN